MMNLVPIPDDYSETYTVDEWLANLRGNWISPEEGSGYWATDRTYCPDLTAFGPKPSWATHVVYFHKDGYDGKITIGK
jgi:hypothetical protein